jgi:hypothetical protein
LHVLSNTGASQCLKEVVINLVGYGESLKVLVHHLVMIRVRNINLAVIFTRKVIQSHTVIAHIRIRGTLD